MLSFSKISTTTHTFVQGPAISWPFSDWNLRGGERGSWSPFPIGKETMRLETHLVIALELKEKLRGNHSLPRASLKPRNIHRDQTRSGSNASTTQARISQLLTRQRVCHSKSRECEQGRWKGKWGAHVRAASSPSLSQSRPASK